MLLNQLAKFEKIMPKDDCANFPSSNEKILCEGDESRLREIISAKLEKGSAIGLVATDSDKREWNVRALTKDFRIAAEGDEQIRLYVGLGSAANALCAVKKSIEANCPAVAGIRDEQTYMLSCVIERADCVIDYSGFTGDKSTKLAGAVGGIFARLISLFDYCVYGLIFDSPINVGYVEAVFKICDAITQKYFSGQGDKKELAETVSMAGVRICLADRLSGKSGICGDGIQQCFMALKRLFSYEKRAMKSHGESTFLLARALIEIYRNGLAAADCCTDIPDNNRRADRLEEYLNVAPHVAVRSVKPLMSAKDMARHAYIKNEYREELNSILDAAQVRIERAFKMFKRMSPDDGYSYLNYLDDSDLKTIISLAPDVGAGYSFLTELKNCGYLEKMLV